MYAQLFGIVLVVLALILLFYHFKSLDSKNDECDTRGRTNLFVRLALKFEDSYIDLIGFLLIVGIIIFMAYIFQG